MKRGWKIMVAVLAVASLATLAACKHGRHGCNMQQLKGHVDAKLKAIGASAEQRAKIGVIADGIIADGENLKQKNKGLCQKFVGCLLLDQPNAEWLHHTVDETAQQFTAFAHRTVDSLIKVSGTLTTEQRAQLKKKIEAGHHMSAADNR